MIFPLQKNAIGKLNFHTSTESQGKMSYYIVKSIKVIFYFAVYGLVIHLNDSLGNVIPSDRCGIKVRGFNILNCIMLVGAYMLAHLQPAMI